MNKVLIDDVVNGLSSKSKFLPSKYFYDEVGSDIFEKITKIPEYYLTEAEREIILKTDTLFSMLDKEINLIELGAGDGSKTIDVLNRSSICQNEIFYHAFDISYSALSKLAEKTKNFHPKVRTQFSVVDFEKGLELVSCDKKRKNVVMFLGSSIGNMTPKEAVLFLKKLSHKLNKDDLWLIGLDLVKDISIMELAYNDPYGLTRDFNLNLLHRLNIEIGTNFDLDQFEHVEYFDPTISSMVSHLRSKINQQVIIPNQNGPVCFEKNELLRTEYSYKYTQEQIQEIADEAGLEIFWQDFDSQNYFTLVAFKIK